MIKTLQKMDRKGTYLEIVKSINDKPIANNILKGEKMKVFPLRTRTRLGCPLTPLFVIQHSSRYNYQEGKETNESRLEKK